MVGVGTGGTICGVAKYLKEKKPSVKAQYQYGSVFKKFTRKPALRQKRDYPHHRGTGEDFLPQNVDFSLIDPSRR